MDIILASGSPRRKQLLAQMGIETFRVISSDADETVEPGLSPARIVEVLSARKAEAVADHAKPGGLVIAADTIVALDGAVLGKPEDERINIPAIPRHYWRWRMHITLEDLLSRTDFNRTIHDLISDSGRG